MTFRVGMKVVSIKTTPWQELEPGEAAPVFRGIYTIRTISFDGGEAFLRFEEIVNPAGDYPADPNDPLMEARFWSVYFRPLTSTTTEISFTTGADPDSEQYDNRRRIPARVREWGASA